MIWWQIFLGWRSIAGCAHMMGLWCGGVGWKIVLGWRGVRWLWRSLVDRTKGQLGGWDVAWKSWFRGLVRLSRGEIALSWRSEVQSLGLLWCVVRLSWWVHGGVVGWWVGDRGVRWQWGKTSRDCSSNELDAWLVVTLTWWRICCSKIQRLCLARESEVITDHICYFWFTCWCTGT